MRTTTTTRRFEVFVSFDPGPDAFSMRVEDIFATDEAEALRAATWRYKRTKGAAKVSVVDPAKAGAR